MRKYIRGMGDKSKNKKVPALSWKDKSCLVYDNF